MIIMQGFARINSTKRSRKIRKISFKALFQAFGARVGNCVRDKSKSKVPSWKALLSSQNLIYRVGLVRFDPQWSAHQNAIFQFICIVKAYWPNRRLFRIRHRLSERFRQKSPLPCFWHLEAKMHQFQLGSTPESSKINSGILTSIWRALKFWMPGGSKF